MEGFVMTQSLQTKTAARRPPLSWQEAGKTGQTHFSGTMPHQAMSN
jgi:hypothetical protein